MKKDSLTTSLAIAWGIATTFMGLGFADDRAYKERVRAIVDALEKPLAQGTESPDKLFESISEKSHGFTLAAQSLALLKMAKRDHIGAKR